MLGSKARKRIVDEVRRVVVKIGTSSICNDAGLPDLAIMRTLASQIAEVKCDGVAVTLVASGAIGAGLGELGLSERPKSLPTLQGVAAVGQGRLMSLFHDCFAEYGIKVAQVLLTRDAFADRTRYLNIRNTLTALDELNALAIINENDPVAVEELRFGDNDHLAALVANLIHADLLVLLTVVDGVLSGGKVVDYIEQVNGDTRALVTADRSKLGTGGMTTKLEAARMMTAAGELAVIANSREKNILPRLLAGEQLGTVFIPAERKMSSRRRWIGHATRVTGKVLVDAGAAKALQQGGKSLLPSGITAVMGKFAQGAVVAVLGPDGTEIARGLTNYDSEQLVQIKGLKTSQIAKTLGDKLYDEVIHRDNMMVH